MMKKDYFGNVAALYAKYRPSYPDGVIGKILGLLKTKGSPMESYLDLATGTGQVLGRLAPHFKNSTGLDISEPQIATAKKTFEENKSIEFSVWNCDEFGEYAENYGHDCYDLITMAQCFHWLQPEKVLT